MLIDHIGMIFFPDNAVLRILGRISMPLFAYSVSRGFYYTNKKGALDKYIKRLALFSIVSQLPYSLTMYLLDSNPSTLNIGFTWFLGLVFLFCAVKGVSDKKRIHKFLFIVGACLCILLPLLLDMSYGISGILYPCSFYFLCYRNDTVAEKSPNIGHLILCVTLLSTIYIIETHWLIQFFSILAIPVLLFAREYDDLIKLPKAFFYIFYPLHISVLITIWYVINTF